MDKTWYFVLTKDKGNYIHTCIGTKELAKFLDRQEWRIKKDLLLIKRKRKEEHKLIKDKHGNEYRVLNEKEFFIDKE